MLAGLLANENRQIHSQQEAANGLMLDKSGVSDGARTRDISDHNRVLYQLSYAHHVGEIVRGVMGSAKLRSIYCREEGDAEGFKPE